MWKAQIEPKYWAKLLNIMGSIDCGEMPLQHVGRATGRDCLPLLCGGVFRLDCR